MDVAEADTRWRWIEAIGDEVNSASATQRVLLGWSATAAGASAVTFWLMIDLVARMDVPNPGLLAISLLVLAYSWLRLADDLAPGGLNGLLGLVIKGRRVEEHDPATVLEIVLLNLKRVRRRWLALLLLDLLPTAALVFVASGASALSGETALALAILVTFRLVGTAIDALFGWRFFSIDWIKRSIARTRAAMKTIEESEKNPHLSVILEKLGFVWLVGGFAKLAVFHSLQIGVALAVAVQVGGVSPDSIRLLLLISSIPFLATFAGLCWLEATRISIRVDHLDDFREDLLANRVGAAGEDVAYHDVLTVIYEDLTYPYEMPPSVYEAMGLIGSEASAPLTDDGVPQA